MGISIRRVGLEQQSIGRALLDDLAKRGAARPCDQPREREVEAKVQEAPRPVPLEGEVVHDAPEPSMPGDCVGDLGISTTVMDRYGQIELEREVEHFIEPVPLRFAVWTADVLEVEADLPYGHHHLVRRELPERVNVRRGLLQRVVPDPGPHLLEAVGKRDGATASWQVNTHRDHPRHACVDRALDHLVRFTQLLEVEMRIYEDCDGSSSTTSSSRLKSASGTGSLRPGGSFEGFQRSSLE